MADPETPLMSRIGRASSVVEKLIGAHFQEATGLKILFIPIEVHTGLVILCDNT